MNKNFRKRNIFNKHLAIDEMIRYYGHYPIKQFIKSKPIRFGYKLWALCESYTNWLTWIKSSKSYAIGGEHISHITYFDNFFSSHSLLSNLKQNGYRATGTIISDNRTTKCTVMAAKEMDKKERGSYDYRFETSHGKMIARWRDNKSVFLATNFDSVEPTVNVQRWIGDLKEKVSVPQPLLVNNYNQFIKAFNFHQRQKVVLVPLY
nr:unnamed protein product [Callosobruchus chinensis]